MAKLPQGKNPEKVADTVIRLLMLYKKNVLTITTDNGCEFACHKKCKKTRNYGVFCRFVCIMAKGAIENGNKLIRQYIPKGSDFRMLSGEFIREVQYKINRRPREKLNFSTPKKEFFKLIS